MTEKEIIRRKIFLKRQHVTLINQEIEGLERELRGFESDLEPSREIGVEEQEAAAI